jgi:hypothetical protein
MLGFRRPVFIKAMKLAQAVHRLDAPKTPKTAPLSAKIGAAM